VLIWRIIGAPLMLFVEPVPFSSTSMVIAILPDDFYITQYRHSGSALTLRFVASFHSESFVTAMKHDSI
jgi:hypothetical protein